MLESLESRTLLSQVGGVPPLGHLKHHALTVEHSRRDAFARVDRARIARDRTVARVALRPATIKVGQRLGEVRGRVERGRGRGPCRVSAPTRRRRSSKPTASARSPGWAKGKRSRSLTPTTIPTIASDLHTFDRTFGLTDPTLTKFVPTSGKPAYNAGWAMEITLNVEWAHAIAPGANIMLVEAGSATPTALFRRSTSRRATARTKSR